MKTAERSDAYLRKLERSKSEQASAVRFAQDIAPIPPVTDPRRRAATMSSLRRFNDTYFAHRFWFDWSPDHVKAIDTMERAILRGGLFALAMPRGSGKTSLVVTASIWAALTGRRRFILTIGQSKEAATSLLSNMVREMRHNDLLLADFPEAIYPIRCLDGESRKQAGQRYYGNKTGVRLGDEELVFATIPGCACSGTILRVVSIMGNIRGALQTTAANKVMRPDMAIIDDPQDDDSANSAAQTEKRCRIINGAVLGTAGPGSRIAAVMPCTVIAKNDLADRFLDSERSPEWVSIRSRMVERWPDEQKLWQQYAQLRRDSIANGGDGEDATALYRDNFDVMNAGAAVPWVERFDRASELSALQHAWNLRIRDERTFFAEYQNDPIADDDGAGNELDPTAIAQRTTALAKLRVPIDADTITAFVDVQGKLLYYVVIAWRSSDFTGWVIDYGAWPDQASAYFTLANARRTIAGELHTESVEACVYGALDAVGKRIIGREYLKETGEVMRCTRCLIDANWGRSTDTVYKWCRESPFAGVCLPSHGRYVGAASMQFDQYRRQPGDRVGMRWRLTAVATRRAVRYALFDTNWWKSFAADRLTAPVGEPGAMMLFAAHPSAHEMWADQVCAERRKTVEAKGRKVEEWSVKQPGADNHFLDCVVGATVAASISGVQLGIGPPRASATPRRRLSEIQAEKRGFR